MGKEVGAMRLILILLLLVSCSASAINVTECLKERKFADHVMLERESAVPLSLLLGTSKKYGQHVIMVRAYEWDGLPEDFSYHIENLCYAKQLNIDLPSK